MPVIKLQKTGINQPLFGVPFHESVSEHSVDERTLAKFRATGELYEVVTESLNQTKQIEKLNKEKEGLEEKYNEEHQRYLDKALQYESLENDYAALMEQCVKKTERVAQLEAEKYLMTKLDNRARSIRGK